MDNLLKLSEYAKLVSKTPQAVRKAISDGRIRKGVSQGKRGYLIDPAVANKEWNSNTDQSQQRNPDAIRAGKSYTASDSEPLQALITAKRELLLRLIKPDF